MAWTLSDDVEGFLAAAGPALHADPVRHTLAVTISAALRVGKRFSELPPVFAWHTSRDEVDGLALMTPPFPLQLAQVPCAGPDGLAASLHEAGHPVSGVGGRVEDVAGFARAWQDLTGQRANTTMRQRLYRLATLRAPAYPVPGRARTATEADVDRATAWWDAFALEAHERRTDSRSEVASRIAEGRIALWEDDRDRPVALAGRSPTVARAARVGPVYTTPEHRRRGFGAAVTAASTQAALDEGAEHVVLFTDLANPTSNAIYQQIGYVGVEDRTVIEFC
jgi:predicted GNAT family acetyltransferase